MSPCSKRTRRQPSTANEQLPVAGCRLPVASNSWRGAFLGRSYKDLVAWNKSMDLVTAIIDQLEPFPKTKCLASLLNSAGPQSRFPAILLKDKGDCREGSSAIF